METTVLTFKYKKTESVKTLLFVVLLSGLYFAVINKSYLGLIIACIGLYFIITSKGIVLDFGNKKIKRARLFRKWSIGSWNTIPQIKYISVFGTTMTYTPTSLSGRGICLREKVYSVSLVHDKNKKMFVYEAKSPQEAIDKAQIISKHFSVRIYDATAPKGKWI
ncbi:MAG: hypothetical protein IPO21_16075 [Bacteroidales bacterium]|nr:hypothetical protein [Bacteroidales bacterium]